MAHKDVQESAGVFDWAYKGVDHSFPGNGGLECRDFLSVPQRILESVAACAVAAMALAYAWPHLKLPECCSCIYHQKCEPLGKRILLFLMCLTFGIELGFKFATRQMIWIGNPCHIATMVQIFILAAPPSKVVTAAFRLQMHMLTGAPIAILFPVINTRLLPFETGVYFLQHVLMLIIPFYLMHIGDPFIPEPLGDFSWALTALGFLFVYHFVPLQLLAYISEVNLNNMLCPAVSDPFHGPFYRMFAIGHQLFLVLTLGKVFVIIARTLKLLPYNNQLNVSLCQPENYSASTTCYKSVVDRQSSQPHRTGDCGADRYDNCHGAGILNCGHKNAMACHSGGDCVSSCTNDHSYGNHNTVYQEDNTGCCSTIKYSTQHIINGHLIMDIQTHEHCRKRVGDLSTTFAQRRSETPVSTGQCCQHNSSLSSDLNVSSSNQECELNKNISDKEKSQNGHTNSHH